MNVSGESTWVTAVKMEDTPKEGVPPGVIVRLFEAEGETTDVGLEFMHGLGVAVPKMASYIYF